MAVLAAELVLTLRDIDSQVAFGRHLRSAANYLADALSTFQYASNGSLWAREEHLSHGQGEKKLLRKEQSKESEN